MSKRAEDLAARVARGHEELISYVETLSEAEWRRICPNDGRSVGVLVHHLATYLVGELNMVGAVASGEPIEGLTPEMVDEMNDQHAREHAGCERQETLALLRQNSARAVRAIRELSDAELDRAAPVSLHWDAPVTAQYLVEDHPLAHAYEHLASIRAAVAHAAGDASHR